MDECQENTLQIAPGSKLEAFTSLSGEKCFKQPEYFYEFKRTENLEPNLIHAQ